MPQAEKVAEVGQLEERLAKSQSVVLVEFTGLSVAELTSLRGDVRQSGGELRVTKNTLLGLAARKLEWEGLDPYLNGPTLVAFGYEDPVATVKVVAQFGQGHAEQWRLKAGVLEGRVLSAEDVARLAQVPAREELLTQLARVAAAPATRLARVLSEPIASLARALHAVAQAQSSTAA